MFRFKTILEIIGINPFVFVPEKILLKIFTEVKRSKGPIPVCGTINGIAYTQTLLRFRGHWRLYINTKMLDNSPKRIGETILITLKVDNKDRTIKPHPKLVKALRANKEAKKVFDSLSPSMQKEIVRYISFLKSEASITNNVEKASDFC
jgi:Domain of unknown function (DUF1905).